MTRPTEGSRADEPRGGMSGSFRPLCLVLAAVLVFQLFYLGAQPFAAGLIREPWDKAAHLAVYSGISALLWLGTAGRMPLAVIAAVIACGGLDELHQAGIPGRTADILDFLTDACAALGTVPLLQAQRRLSP
jgi:VanZ family protein